MVCELGILDIIHFSYAAVIEPPQSIIYSIINVDKMEQSDL
jgi:hypothetical protein